MNITVYYSCNICKLEKIPCEVPARKENEKLDEWMENTVIILGKDHKTRSPKCKSKQLNNLILPMTGANRVGGPTIQ